MDPIVIIGSGLAGYTVAREYRKFKKNDILIVTQDDGAFYSKPMLSNGFAKNKSARQLETASAAKMSEDYDIRIKRNTIIAKINLSEKMLITSENDEIKYSKLVLATGAQPIKLDLTVKESSKRFFHVNSLQDYSMFRDALDKSKDVTIIGPGLIGCEFANDLVQAGYNVNVIGPSDTPLDSLLPAEVGEFLKDSLSSIGIHWFLQTTVQDLHETDSRVILTLTNGKKIEADIVLSAIGVKPNIQLAEEAGIKVNRGIVVDKFLHTSESGVYALGDCAELDGKVLPYILPLMTEARALAKTLAGEATETTYPVMPIVVKTPASPIVICPPDRDLAGRWLVESSETGVSACFYDKYEKLKGFSLIGEAIAEKQNLLKKL